MDRKSGQKVGIWEWQFCNAVESNGSFRNEQFRHRDLMQLMSYLWTGGRNRSLGSMKR